MKMRNPAKQHCARLKHAKGQIFTCGMFGTCSDSVLSPRTPPALVISNPIAPNAAAPPAPKPQQQQAQQQQPALPPALPPQAAPKQQEPEDEQPQSIPSPDTVSREKLISQWDFGLKQKQLQQQQQQQQQQQAHLQEQLHISQMPLGERVKERYVGLVDRDLSPFQQQLLNGGTVSGGRPFLVPKEEDLAVDLNNVSAVCKEITGGRISKAMLRSLRVHADEDEKKRASILQSGVLERLLSLLGNAASNPREAALQREAFSLIATLADDDRTQGIVARSPAAMAMLDRELKKRTADAWVLLCKSSTNEEVVNPSSTSGILSACVELLKDPCAEAKLVRLALKALLGICLSKSNRAAAVEAGAVAALVETLADLHGADGGDFCSRAGIVVNVERALATLELLCTTPQGRAAACAQRGFVTELVGLVLGVSERATEYAAGVLCAVLCDAEAALSPSTTATVAIADAGGDGDCDSVQEMAVRRGAPAQMLLVMQSECSERARRKAAKLLKALHKYGEDHSTILDSDLASTITY